MNNFFLPSPRNKGIYPKIIPNKVLPSLLSPEKFDDSSSFTTNKCKSPFLNETPTAVKRFTAPNLTKAKSNRSVSPVMKFIVQENSFEKKIFEKYKNKRVEFQEREINLQRLANILKEKLETGSSENEKVSTILEIIKILVMYFFLTFSNYIFFKIK